MRGRLEEDGSLLQVYALADYLKAPIAVVRRMTLDEFNGWIAYRRWVIEQEERTRDG